MTVFFPERTQHLLTKTNTSSLRAEGDVRGDYPRPLMNGKIERVALTEIVFDPSARLAMFMVK
jgi:hypothetical protein